MYHRRTVIRLVIALFAVLITAGGASAQINKAVALIKGEIHSPDGGIVKDVVIQIYKGSEKVNNTKSTIEGKFQAVLQPNATYRFICSNPNYYYMEQELNIPSLEKYQEIPVSITMRKLEVGMPFPFKAPVFEPRSASISKDVMVDLDGISAQMKRNNKISLSVTVYPDEMPSGKKASVQTDLANSRKSALSAYFLSKGITTSSMSISTSNAVPTGIFERAAVAEDPKNAKVKKKKKQPAAAKTMKAPQTAVLIMSVG